MIGSSRFTDLRVVARVHNDVIVLVVVHGAHLIEHTAEGRLLLGLAMRRWLVVDGWWLGRKHTSCRGGERRREFTAGCVRLQSRGTCAGGVVK